MEHDRQIKLLEQAEEESQVPLQTAPCPCCKRRYYLRQICTFEHMDFFTQRVLKERLVKCPFKCAFVGNSFYVDEHQVYTCPRRLLRCPNADCNVTVEAEQMEKDHFPTCPLRRVHCVHCKLAVLASEEETHDCIKRLQSALTSM